MFQLTRRISLAENVADLLQLQGSLHGQGIVQTAPHKENMFFLADNRSEPLKRLLRFQRQSGQIRQSFQPAVQFLCPLVCQRTPELPQRNGQKQHHFNLRDIGFGAGHCDLRPCIGIERPTLSGLSGKGGAHHIANGDHPCAAPLGLPNSCQRICRLTALGNGDKQFFRPNDRIAVAVFTGDLHIHGHPRQLFNDIPADHTCMASRSATGNDDPLQPPRFFPADRQPAAIAYAPRSA